MNACISFIFFNHATGNLFALLASLGRKDFSSGHYRMTYVLRSLVTRALFHVDYMVSHLTLIEIMNSNILQRASPNITIEINAMLMTVLEVMM